MRTGTGSAAFRVAPLWRENAPPPFKPCVRGPVQPGSGVRHLDDRRRGPDIPFSGTSVTAANIHLIVDNYATHKHPKVKAWLASRPRYRMHYTPTYASWTRRTEARIYHTHRLVRSERDGDKVRQRTLLNRNIPRRNETAAKRR